MYCAICWNSDTKVLDSRVSENGKTIKRRRECCNCGIRFTTYEKQEEVNIVIEKSNGNMEEFNEKKLNQSILRAFNKRNLTVKMMDKIIENVKNKLHGKKKITSQDLGYIILKEIQWIDDVAYIRYASVFFWFQTIQDYQDFISKNY